MTKDSVLILMVVAVGLGLAFVAGCESKKESEPNAVDANAPAKAQEPQYPQVAQTGAAIGSLAGAGIGQLAGGDTESTLIGAAIGDSLRQEMNTVTVNITNSNGSVSQILLRKQGVGYFGPRCVYYNHLPTEEELKPIYGF